MAIPDAPPADDTRTPASVVGRARSGRTGLRLAVAVALLLAGAAAVAELAEARSPAGQTRHVTLYVREGRLPTTDGASIYVWGFADDPDGPPRVPGPPIVVDEGDTVEVTLVNDRDPTANERQAAGEGHTIHLHGLDVPTEHDGVPETHPPGLVRQGGSFTYRFVATHAGTYFYHCHQNNVEHQQMGMYGPLVVNARGGARAAYTDGPAFDREQTVVLAELDAEGHERARAAVRDGGDPHNWLGYRPSHVLVDGRIQPIADEVRIADPARPGERLLVRLINAGYVAHTVRAHGRPFRIVATDGRPWPAGPTSDAVTLGPGERYDLLVDGADPGGSALHDHVDAASAVVAPPSAEPATAPSAPGGPRRLTLYVRDGWKTMPDGARVYVYGFTDDPNAGPSVPGPQISARAGEAVEVTLVNDRDPTGTGHGLRILAPDVRLEGPALVGPGASETYRFVAGRPGSYLYTGDADGSDDRQMGLYGAVVIRHGDRDEAGAAHAEPERAYTMVLSEMDAAGHEQARRAVAEGARHVDWSRYAPNYFLINGLAYPDTEADPSTMMRAAPGERILIRAVNAGRVPHAMHLHGFHFRVANVAGRPWPDGPVKDTVLIRPGEGAELHVLADQPGRFPFHDHFEVANTNNGVWLGGMHTMLEVGAGRHHGAPTPATPTPAAAGEPAPAASVAIRDNYYAPNQVTVPVGATVRWEHQGQVEHTVSSLLGAFDSGALPPGSAFSQTFAAPGRYDYFCRFHVTNRGTVVVR